MYIPKYYENKDIEEVEDFIIKNSFAILVSQVNDRPWATHLPLTLEKRDGKYFLFGHISKANRQWKTFENNQEIMVIFNGSHAYISPSWYDHENVPTWNYLAVHVYGCIRIIDKNELKEQLGKLIDKHETGLENPIQLSGISSDYIEKEMRGIIGIEIKITDINAAAKLSQNRDGNNYNRIIDGLMQKGDPDSVKMAEIMKNRKV